MTELQAAAATAMIVDDKPENLHLLEITLEQDGVRVLSFPSGELALKAMQTDPPDVVLLDVCMPGINGFDVCRSMKSNPLTADVPVIFISALSDTENILQAFEVGGADYAVKPIRATEIRARVMLHLKLRQTQRDLAARNSELRTEHDALQRMEQLRDDLVHMMVHDMRSPLQGILGNLQLLEASTTSMLSDEDQSDLSECVASTRRLIRMVSTIVDISRMEQHQMPLEPTASDSRSLTNMALQVLGTLPAEHPILLEGGTIPLTCDNDLIVRVLTNLLDNAVKYSPPGRSIHVGAAREASSIRFWVRNRGKVLTKRECEIIFDKFQVFDDPHRKRAPSSGLGLPFCRLAVEAHGGRIYVESDENTGTTFSFVLPA